MAEQLLETTGTVPDLLRIFRAGDKTEVVYPITLAVLAADVAKKGVIVFGATKATNMAQALDAAMPAETDFIGILPEDLTPGVAVAAGQKFAMIVEAELSRPFVADKNPGLSGANLLIIEEILAKRGLHLLTVAYGDTFAP